VEAFRHFKDRSYANDLLSGKVWVGTLNGYRKCEQDLRGDPDEGTKIYRLNFAHGSSDEPHMQEVMRRAAINVQGCSNVRITNATNTSTIADAYVLCLARERITRLEDLDVFGGICVRIRDVDLFAHRVTKQLQRSLGFSFHETRGPVQYSGTAYEDLSPDPGTIGFIKDPRFSAQREYRIMWRSNNAHTYHGRIVHVPRIAELCTIHSPTD
jgi:hypothetical protein